MRDETRWLVKDLQEQITGAIRSDAKPVADMHVAEFVSHLNRFIDGSVSGDQSDDALDYGIKTVGEVRNFVDSATADDRLRESVIELCTHLLDTVIYAISEYRAMTDIYKEEQNALPEKAEDVTKSLSEEIESLKQSIENRSE